MAQKNKRTLGILFLLGLMGNIPVHATNSSQNGSWLLGQCSGLFINNDPTPGNTFCAGYIQGVMQSWYTAETQVNPKGALFWINQFGNIPAFEAAQMVLNYLNHNPQDLSHNSVDLIIAAINQNYPIPTPSTENS